MPATARILQHPKSVWIATTRQPADTHPLATKPGVRILAVPGTDTGGVDLAALLEKLDDLGIRSVMVEGGARIISSVLSQDLADFAVVTVAPNFMGGTNVISQVSPSSGQPVFGRLLQATTSTVGDDFIIWGALGRSANARCVGSATAGHSSSPKAKE
jgi:riboflavin biosynthesis pyrimidine reductase